MKRVCQNMTILCHTNMCQVSFKIYNRNSLTKKVLSVLCNQSLYEENAMGKDDMAFELD